MTFIDNLKTDTVENVISSAVQLQRHMEGADTVNCPRCTDGVATLKNGAILCTCGFSAFGFDPREEYCEYCAEAGSLCKYDHYETPDGFDAKECSTCGNTELMPKEKCACVDHCVC